MSDGLDGTGVMMRCCSINRETSVKLIAGRGESSNKRFVIVIVLSVGFSLSVMLRKDVAGNVRHGQPEHCINIINIINIVIIVNIINIVNRKPGIMY